MANKIQVRRDTSANWTSANPILAEGEPAMETDTLLTKTGNGVSTWDKLSHNGSVLPLNTDTGATVYITPNDCLCLLNNATLIVLPSTPDVYTPPTGLYYKLNLGSSNREILFKDGVGEVVFDLGVTSIDDDHQAYLEIVWTGSSWQRFCMFNMVTI